MYLRDAKSPRRFGALSKPHISLNAKRHIWTARFGANMRKGSVMKSSLRRRGAFTLIEVLIVVVIMAVLAATIIPQFSTSTRDAQDGSLKFNLSSLRTQIELYKLQHGAYPGATIVNQLTLKTDKSGATGTGATHVYGPYVFGGFPTNPVNGLATVNVVTTATVTPGNTHGYIYSSATGEIRADNTGNDGAGVAYSTY